MHNEKTTHRSVLTPSRWTGSGMLETVQRLNTRCIALLAEAALERSAGQYSAGVYASRELWMGMDEPACRRAGTCPVLLLDLKFHDTAWWVTAADPAQRAATAGGPLADGRFAKPLREALLEAWSMARPMPQLLAFPLGIAPGTAAVIGKLSLADLDRVLACHGDGARPRWPQNRRFWDMLLMAAVNSDEEALQHARLYSLQLLGGEFLKPLH